MKIQAFTVDDPKKKVTFKMQGNVQECGLISSGDGDVIIRILGNTSIQTASIFIKKGNSDFEKKFLSSGEILLRDCRGKLEFYLTINGEDVKFNGTELFCLEVASFEEWLRILFSKSA